MSKRKTDALERIADALERIAPTPPTAPDFSAPAYLWHDARRDFVAAAEMQTVPIEYLVGIDRARDTLLNNTRHFAAGHGGNNALLWGSRGMGKSTLIKAVVQAVRDGADGQGNPAAEPLSLGLVEILREDLARLGEIFQTLRDAPERVIVFCDDLSFEYDEAVYKSLKAALDGGVMGTPKNILFYATSNRRHLMARDMIENERSTGVHDSEAKEEKVSLSDRFGLWLGFHKADQDAYLAIIEGYLAYFDIDDPIEKWRPSAIEWTMTRGARNGRVAWQFVQDYRAQRAHRG